MNPEDDFLLGPMGTYAGPRTAGDVAYGAGATGLLFAPGAGVTDLMGYAPDPFQPGEYLPSFGANIREGNYLDAALQTLGGAGDVMMAGGAFLPPLVGVGAAMKAPRAARVTQSAPASIRAYHGSPHDFAPAVRVLDTETGKTYVQEAGDPILTGLMAQNPGRYEIIEENPLGMFDLSKIGTGEGAQAFGEGAYLSGSEGIAKGYRDRLSKNYDGIKSYDYFEVPPGDARTLYGETISFDDVPGLRVAEKNLINSLRVGGAKYDDMVKLSENPDIKALKEKIDALNAENAPMSEYDKLYAQDPSLYFDYDNVKNFEGAKQKLGELGVDLKEISYNKPGKMYEAEIKVGPEELLDYDKPFHAQTPDIKKRMRDMVENELTRDDAINLGFEESNPSPYFEFGYDIDDGVVVDMGAAREFMLRDDTTVDEFLGNWQAIRGSTDAGEFLLKKYGIPGLKYKAAGSRTPGMDEADIDRNYVIFDENIINILRKYGLLAPLVGGGTAAAVMGADEPQPAGGIL